MDDVTRKVRSMYELFPYPSRSRGTVADIHPYLMLAYPSGPPLAHPPTILDAGCGTGMAALGTALCNPDAEVVAVDLNRAALSRVREEARELGIRNLEVREVNLVTLEGLPVPEGGYDVIFSSGVLHHLPDPARGLRLLAGVLAPGGVLRVMVYNKFGRHSLYRFVEAMDRIEPDRDEPSRRLSTARRLMAALRPGGPVTQPPWEDALTVDDVEFVDRYLHPHDIGFTVASFFELVERAGLSFLRWYEPREWSLESVCADHALCRDLGHLSPVAAYEVVERLGHRIRLDALLCHPGVSLRPAVTREELLTRCVALSPQASLTVSRRVSGHSWYEFQPTISVRDGPAESLLPEAFRLLDRLGTRTAIVQELLLPGKEQQLQDVALELLRREVLYLPAGR
ncbi:MAG: class I SAM-dependent methyltransferase [Armatimonadetes bacterium]|nr:class I SAM-dependent methyltransferase [Armatimonadota bacterium]